MRVVVPVKYKRLKRWEIKGFNPFKWKVSNWKFKLLEEYKLDTGILPVEEIDTDYINLSTHGRLTIKTGYAWDGATGGIDTKTFIRGSLIHDCGCQLIALDLLDQEYRIFFDKLLLEVCIIDGMYKIRATLAYYSIRIFVFIAY